VGRLASRGVYEYAYWLPSQTRTGKQFMTRFSLVLTTTDRPELLLPAVVAAVQSKFDDFEVLVSDNFSKISGAEILTDVKDKRLRIIRTDRRLPASDHWEYAWEHVRGEYVMYLGDDNALHPDILSTADRAIRQYDLDALAWRVGLYYHPDWNIDYGTLPNRGNIVGIDAGTTGQLYRCDADKVIAHYCSHLTLSGCFPCMLNFLFRKSDGDAIRRQAGRLFWPPAPDVCCGFLLMGVARPGHFAFWDGFGGLGGRSRNSNLATQLSRGKATRKFHDYVSEFRGQDIFPLHEPKYVTISNTLAAVVSQARNAMPERFAALDFDRATLARKTIDDIYVSRVVPWMEDPTFLGQVDQFIVSLPPAETAAIEAYRDECRARMEADNAAQVNGAQVRNRDGARKSIFDLLRSRDRAFGWRLFRDTGRSPVGRYWTSGGTSYIDMSLYGGSDVADAARLLPRVLATFDRPGDSFAGFYRQLGMLGEELTGGKERQSSAAGPTQMAASQ
jgi:Glycosyl transferase family 2